MILDNLILDLQPEGYECPSDDSTFDYMHGRIQ